MSSAKFKTQIYLLIFSLAVSLVGMAVMRCSQGGQGADAPKAMTDAQKMKALENAAPQSPQMAKFLEREKASQEANQEVGDLSK